MPPCQPLRIIYSEFQGGAMWRDLSKQIAQCCGSFHKNVNACLSLQSDFGLQSWNLSQSWQLDCYQSQSSVLRRWGHLWLSLKWALERDREKESLTSCVSYGGLMFFFFCLFLIFQFLVYDTNIWLSVFYSSVYIQ